MRISEKPKEGLLPSRRWRLIIKNTLLGYTFDIFDAAFIKLFLDFVKENGGPITSTTPIEMAMVNNKQFFEVRQRNKYEMM